MKKFVLTILMCLLLLPLVKGDAVDSIRQSLTNAKKPDKKALILNTLVRHFTEVGLLDSAMVYVDKAIKLEQKFNLKELLSDSYNLRGDVYYYASEYKMSLAEYRKALAIDRHLKHGKEAGKKLNNIGLAYQNMGSPDSALAYFKTALKQFIQIKDIQGQINCYGNLGNMYNDIGQYDKAIASFEKSLPLIEQKKDRKLLSYIYSNLGNSCILQSNYPGAQQYYLRSLRIAEELHDTSTIIRQMGNLGGVYNETGDIDKALKYYSLALRSNEKRKNQEGIALYNGNLGVTYFEKGDIITAKKYLLKSLAFYEKVDNPDGVAFVIGNLGICLTHQKKYDSALFYFNKALTINRKIQNRNGVTRTLASIGSVHYHLKNYALAETFLIESIALSDSLGAIDLLVDQKLKLSEVYASSGKFDLAIESHNEYVRMRDSLFSSENQKNLISQQYQYEYDKKTLTDSLVRVEEKKIQHAKIQRQRIQKYYLYGGIGLTVIFALFMFNRFRATTRQRKTIERQTIELERQKSIVEDKQKEILDSIHYAKRIQQALLPTNSMLEKGLSSKKKNP